MESIGVGDRVVLKDNHIVNGNKIPIGTILEITFVDRQGIPYCCECLDRPISLWLTKDQFDVLKVRR